MQFVDLFFSHFGADGLFYIGQTDCSEIMLATVDYAPPILRISGWCFHRLGVSWALEEF